MSDKQLSRVAGCPRLPLPVFKAAAEQYFVGKDATRTEQQNGKKSKVKLLRELSTNDPAVRSWLIKFAKEYKAGETRKIAAEQGLTINADGRAVTDIDRMVAMLEAGQKLEDHFTAEELSAPAEPDPAHDALWAGYQTYLKTGSFKPSTPTCNHCAGPVTHTLPRGDGFFTYWCDRHVPAVAPTRKPSSRLCGIDGCTEDWKTDFDGTKRCDKHANPAASFNSEPGRPDPQSPASYINSGFGKSEPSTDPRALALKALAEAYAGAHRARGGADYPPTEPLK